MSFLLRLFYLEKITFLLTFFSFSGCDGQPDDDESAKSLNSNCDNQASSSMMEETTSEHDLQVSFFYFSKKLVFDFPNRNDFTVS